MALVAPPDFEAAVAQALGITGYDVGSLAVTVVNAAEAQATTTVRFTVAYEIDTVTLIGLFTQLIGSQTAPTPQE